MMIILSIGFLVGVGLIAYGLYAKYWYTHPADYGEGTVVIRSENREASLPGQGSENDATSSVNNSTKTGQSSTTTAGTGVVIDGVTFRVDIADTIPKQAQGLSDREPLAADEGMLFIFPFARVTGFWMYHMKFALDMIWIKGDTILGISENVPAPAPGAPSSTLPIYYPPSAVDKVLEVNAGTAAKWGFKAGDRVQVVL
jgi:uncharacterized membrane protein (UPF0127 family)